MLKKVLSSKIIQISTVILLSFFIQIYAASQGLMEQYFILETPLEKYPWTIITAVFAHSGINHLTSNMTGLLLFGIPVAWKASTFKFHLFFISTGALAGISQVLTSYYLYQIGFGAEPIGVVGASGAVFALMGYLITSNKVSEKTSQYIPLPNKLRYLLYFGVATWITLATASPQAALIGHFTGLMLGLVAGKKNLLRKKLN